LEVPEKELKTYVIDRKTFEVVRSFDGWLRDYWADLDMVLTESEHEVYFVDGVETTTRPEGLRISVQDRDFTERTVLTLWNRSTSEKIRQVTTDRRFSGGDDSPLRMVQRKALLWNAQARTTDVVDLVTGKPLDTLPGYVRFISEDESVLMVQEGDNISLHCAKTLAHYRTVPGRTLRLSTDQSRFIAGPDRLGGARVYELKTGKEIGGDSFPAGDDYTLNQDGTKLLVRHKFPAEVRLWDVDTGKRLWSAPFGGKDSDGYTFWFSEDGKIIMGDCNLTLPIQPKDYPRTYVWNAQTGKEIAIFEFVGKDRYFGKANRMFASLTVDGDYKHVLCDATTGETITKDLAGSFAAVSQDEKRFLTIDKNTLRLWNTETGTLLHMIESERIDQYRTNIVFDANPALIRATLPNTQMDSRFLSQEALFDIETGKIVKQEDILPTHTRHGDIVWKSGETDAVFWNLEDGQPFFTIRLLSPNGRHFGANIIGPIHFTPDSSALIYSTNMRPWRQRVIF
jgi:WD40 repeat protein